MTFFFWLLFNPPIFQKYSRLQAGSAKEEPTATADAWLFIGQMPFLLLNQQCHSNECLSNETL